MSDDELPPHYGHGVSGHRFWKRAELNFLLRRVRLGNSVSIFGPRRNGKSSLLKEGARILKEDGQLTIIEVDGQGMDAVASLFNRIVASLPSKSFESFRVQFTNLKLPQRMGEIVDLWRGKSRESRDDAMLITRHWAALSQLIAKFIPTMKARPVLMIDEITYLCENLEKQDCAASEEVTRLLAMLKEWREAGMVVVMAGSIGIRQYLRVIGVSLNLLIGIIPITLRAMSRDDAGCMLAALARHQEIGWWDEQVSLAVIENSADLTQAAMQFAFDHVVPAVEESNDYSRSAIDELFRDVIRPHFDHEFYEQYTQRLRDYSDSDQKIIRILFQTISASTREPKACSYKEIEEAILAASDDALIDAFDLSELIHALAEDGFLNDDPDQDRISFASNMVASWWRVRDHRRGRRR